MKILEHAAKLFCVLYCTFTCTLIGCKIFISFLTDLMLADMSARQRSSRRRYPHENKLKPSITIGIPQDFRRVSSIVDADMLPDTLRRVKLLKHSSDRPLGFYIRDGTSVRVTPYGLEKVPGIFISRLVPGGLAEGTGLLAVNDEILEVNGIEVTGKSLDQVTDMMVANSHNLIITVKPAQQPAQTPRAQSMANLTGKPKPGNKGSRSKIDGMTQSAKITSRSQGDIPSAIPSTPPSVNRSSKRSDPDRHSRTSGRDMMSPSRDHTSRDHTDSSHHNDVTRARSHGPEITEVYNNDSGTHMSSSSHKYQVPSNPNGIQSPTHETS